MSFLKHFTLIMLFVFWFQSNSYCQSSHRILFIVDSIPILTDPEPWDQLLPEDIAETSTLKNKDSINLLGWDQMDAIVYVFTKAYRGRPDSLKLIPSLLQMTLSNGVWMFRNNIYTGRYRNYYLDGQLQAEGRLVNGKIDGEVIVYFKNGEKKSVIHYSDGLRQGDAIGYYKNGSISTKIKYKDNAQIESNTYFINGKLMDELKTGIGSKRDTLIQYYSSGKIKKIKIGYRGSFDSDSKKRDLNYYTTMFYENIRSGNLRSANKDLYHINQLDVNSIETIFLEGILLAHEFRFDKAIEQFDKALAMEPLMKQAFAQRAISRIKLFKYKGIPLQVITEKPLVLDDLKRMPEDEQVKVCTDLMIVDFLDISFEFSFKEIPEEILHYCRDKKAIKDPLIDLH